MSWNCPHEDKGSCRRAGGACQPGKKGCVLKDKVKFGFIGDAIELRISNGKIWRPRFELDARRDDEGVAGVLRRGGATPQQAKDRPTKFPLVIRSSIRKRMINNCPGQDPKKLEAKNIKCPSCGYEIEIFSDEVKARCPKCPSTAYLERMPSCIDWCRKAEDCVGQEYYKRHTESKSFFLKDKLIKELEGYFGSDIERITHAKKVMEFAEEILRKEGGSWHIVVPAAILHDVGIKIAEQKYGSSAGHLQEKEGPAVARNILLKLGLKKEEIEEICRIIGFHHSPGKINSPNFGIILDADWLVNLGEIKGKKKREEIINRVFATNTAKEMAKKIYL